jgi:hypothetical protein
VFCVCGWLFCQVSGLIGGGDKSADTSEAPALESAYDEAAESGAAGNSMEALPEESEVQDDAGAEELDTLTKAEVAADIWDRVQADLGREGGAA